MTRSPSGRLTLALGLLGLVGIGTARADNWPRWRGPEHDGASGERDLPAQWGESKNLAWKLKLPGAAASTPCAWGDRIFLTSTDGTDLVLLCVGTDGKELWKRKLGTGGKGGGEGNDASPSPSTDGKHVWAFFGSGDLACLDFDGKEVWKLNVQDRYGKFKYGFGMHSTPVLDGDRLYLQFIHAGGGQVIALDKASGKEVWKVKRESDGRGENEHSYASPTVWRKGKEAYLVTHGNDYCIAHKLDDGGEIWRVAELNPKDKYRGDLRFVSSPVATPDLIVIPSAKDHGVVGLKPGATGKVTPGSPSEAWRLTKGTPDVTSPLVYDGYVYLCRENGALVCLDAKTGKEQYSQRLHGAVYRASPVAAGGLVYLAARDGVVTVVKVGPRFEKVAENKLPDDMAASPVLSGGRIYLRGLTTLWAVGAKDK